MLPYRVICFVFVFSCANTFAEPSRDTLLSVQVLFRHGDRTPIHNIPSDKSNFTWPFPNGILTNQGRTRAYKLGQFLSRRYEEFLTRVSRFDVTSRSSIIPRCMESTALVLAGMLPPKGDEIWSTDEELASMWRPIAIETQPFENDEVLAPKECSATSMIMLHNFNDSSVQKLIHDNMDLIKRVTEAVDFSSDIISLFRIYDVIMCEQAYFGANYTRPGWLSADDLTRLSELYVQGQKAIYRGHSEEDSLRYYRIRVGAFFKYSFKHFHEPAKQTNSAKLGVFGTHDTKIQDLMGSLDMDMGFPGFSTTVAFELWSNSTGSEPYLKLYYIEPVKYFKVTELQFSESNRLKAFCEKTTCSLSKFQQAVETLTIPDDCQ